MARLLGIFQQTYQRYEAGKTLPNPVLLHQIATQIGVSMEELIGLPTLQISSGVLQEPLVKYKAEPILDLQTLRGVAEIFARLLPPEALERAAGKLGMASFLTQPAKLACLGVLTEISSGADAATTESGVSARLRVLAARGERPRSGATGALRTPVDRPGARTAPESDSGTDAGSRVK